MGNVFKKIVGAVSNIFSLKTDNSIAIGYDGSNNMTFKDGVVSGTRTLADLLAQYYHGVAATGALSFDNSTHVVTMAAGGNRYWYKNTEYNTVSAITCDLDSFVTLTANTLYYVYFDDATGTLKASATAWNLKDVVPVAMVFWNGSAGAIYKETHDHTRDIDWHIWAHTTVGARYGAGLDQTAPTTAADASLQIESGTVYDEDLAISVAQQTTMRGWYKASASVFTFADYALPYLGTSGDPKYLDTDTYALTSVGGTKFACYWVYATSDIGRPIAIIPSHIADPYTTISAARSELPPSLAGLNLNPEWKLIYRWIYKGDGQYQEGADYRLSSPLPSGGVANVTAASVSFVPTGTISATTVQGAIEEVATDPPVAHASTHNAGGSDALAIDAAAGTGSLRTIGTTATAACAGNDSRLSDPRTPTAHASSHQSGGSDAIKIDDLAAGDDNTDLNASTTKHGLLPKLNNVVTNFLNGQGGWTAPPVSGFLNEFFGDASDGNVTISVNTTLTKDMHYDTLTINSGIVLNAKGFRVFARTLTFGGANSAISCDGTAGEAYKTGDSTIAAGGDGGAWGSSTPSLGLGGAGGYSVAEGSPGYDGESTTRCPGTTTACDGGKGGDSPDGDAWGSGAAGLSSTHCDCRFPWRNISQCTDMVYHETPSITTYTSAIIRGGAGGSGGGPYYETSKYTGGGGGGGGGVCWVAAKTLNGPASGTAYIRANGGAGGAGRTTTGSGSGGGGGGGGGFALLYYATAGTNFANVTLQANAGGGGAGRAAGSAGVAGVTYAKQVTIS